MIFQKSDILTLLLSTPRGAVLRQARVHIARQRFERADRLLGRALRRRPDDPDLLEQHAYCAHNSGRYALARKRWDLLRARKPSHTMAWAGVACNCREAGDIEAACQTILEALVLFPGDEILFSEAVRTFARAELGEQQEAFLEALLRERPDDRALHSLRIDVLLFQKRFAEAGSLLTELQARFPDCAKLWSRRCRLALALGEWREAIAMVDRRMAECSIAEDHQGLLDAALHGLAHEAQNARVRDPAGSRAAFECVLRHQPDNVAWIAGGVFTLLKLGRVEEAEAEIDDAMRRFPGHPALVPVQASVHATCERWEEAISLLNGHLAVHPQDKEAVALLAGVKYERNCADAVGTAATVYTPMPKDVGLEHDDAKRDLLLTFESLGENCEFGLVQRHFGAEPLSLFRWSSTDVANLSAALRADLEGLGSVEHTSMSTWEDIEYFVADRRWGFATHTFCIRQQVAFDVLYPKMCKRLAFLRRKFLADVASAEKTFVLRSDVADYDDLRTLQDALRRQQPVRLLCVKQLDRLPVDCPSVHGGTVFEVAEGLFLGYVTRFGHTGLIWEILFDEWIAICRGIEDPGSLPFPLDLI